jgi:hypothetical protein
MKLNIQDIGTMIAERQFVGHADGKPCLVIVRIGKPFADEKQEGCWYCPYSITKEQDQRLFYGAGVDSLQALRIAFSNIEADLRNRYVGLNLEWMGDADLGLTGKL